MNEELVEALRAWVVWTEEQFPSAKGDNQGSMAHDLWVILQRARAALANVEAV